MIEGPDTTEIPVIEEKKEKKKRKKREKKPRREDLPELWSVEQMKKGLELLLNANSPERFRGLCDLIAREDGRDVGRNAVRRFYWGMANGFHHISWEVTELRTGPATFAEKLLIRWGANSHTKSRKQKFKPTPEFIAKLIRRPVEFVQEWWRRLGPARGREGFGL